MIIIMTIICRCCSKTSRAWSQTNFANIIILEFIAVCVIALHVFHLSTDVRYIVVVAQQLQYLNMQVSFRLQHAPLVPGFVPKMIHRNGLCKCLLG